MKLLSIGNSFSRDAQRYLHSIACADNFDLYSENLYIPSCSLSRHHKNMLSGECAYDLDRNGEANVLKSSIKEALERESWDVVTFQQASISSFRYECYQPYLNELLSFVRTFVPKAKIVLHQTWAYKNESASLLEKTAFSTHEEMFRSIEKAYDMAFSEIKADLLIPSGALICKLNEKGAKGLFRDDKHAGFGLGRYALGLLWYTSLTGREIAHNGFCDFQEEISPENVALVKTCVEEVRKMGLIKE